MKVINKSGTQFSIKCYNGRLSQSLCLLLQPFNIGLNNTPQKNQLQSKKFFHSWSEISTKTNFKNN